MKLLNLKYFKKIKNIGDVVSPLIIENVSPFSVVAKKIPGAPVLYGLGSLLQGADNSSYIWGTGYIGIGGDSCDLDVKKIYSLRGKLTTVR